MQVSVLGNGRWGTFLAWYAHKIGHGVTLYGRAGSKRTAQLCATRGNGLVTLEEGVRLTTSLHEAIQNRVVLVSVGSQNLRGLLKEIAALSAGGHLFVLCMKGLEIGTGLRLTQVVGQELGGRCDAAVWLGPGHVQEFVRGVPNCMVLDAESEAAKEELVEAFSSDLIRFYYGEDLVGNEIGAAAKNVIGIAAGLLDGFDLASLKGALMSRGTREVARLLPPLGGKALSAYGLCHLGDYEATVFSTHSHNRMFGEKFVKGEPYGELAEGYYTVRALLTLAGQHGVEMPICRAVHDILYDGVPPRLALDALFSRSLKQEFEGA